MLFREWYHDVYGSLIDEPGILYSNLLLMGDGLTSLNIFSSDTYDRLGYHPQYGAGRFRLRAFDGAGLDAPGGWQTGSVCVADGQVVTIDVAGGSPLPAGVDYIKATTWTYDHDHDDGDGNDLFSVRLQKSAGSWVTARLDDSDDSRHRVFKVGVGGEAWRLQILGRSVNGIHEGCGTLANRVYYAILRESNDRDDDSEMTTYVRPEPTE